MKQLLRGFPLYALPLAHSSGAWAQQISQPNEHCLDYSASDIATFADAVLESKVRDALSIGAQANLTCDLAAQLTKMEESGADPRRSVSGSPEWPNSDHLFNDLSGTQNLSGLADVALRNRWLSDNSISVSNSTLRK